MGLYQCDQYYDGEMHKREKRIIKNESKMESLDIVEALIIN